MSDKFKDIENNSDSWYSYVPPTPKELNEMRAVFNNHDWPEDRVDIIGQNGNDGLHYEELDMSKDNVTEFPKNKEHEANASLFKDILNKEHFICLGSNGDGGLTMLASDSDMLTLTGLLEHAKLGLYTTENEGE